MEEKHLSEEQLRTVIDFAQGLAFTERYGYFSPWMQNQLMNNLNNNSQVPKMDALKKALSDYKNSADNIQGYMEFMDKWDMLFARTLKSYSTILSFDLQVVCRNAFTGDDYTSKEYKEDKNRINAFLDSFDYKAEFRKVVEQIMLTEVGYYSFRRSHWGNKGMKNTLQLLPQKYCMLTGYWEKGLLADFDMSYFLNAGVDIDGFDPAFKKKYNNVFNQFKGENNYIPTNPFGDRNGTYSLWTQTSPDEIWPFKFQMDNFNATPFLAPFLKDTIRNDEIEALQYDKDMMAAYGILVGEIRLFENAKSGTKANQFAIDPKTLGTFMGAVKSGLDKRIRAVAMPTENTKFYQYEDKNDGMYDTQLKNVAGTGTSLSRVIYSSDRMGQAELQYSAEAQYQIMKALYPQFQNFLEYFANKLTKKYKFKFIFDGCEYEYERSARFDRLMKMADKGVVLNPSAFASVLGMRPNDFEYSLTESKYSGWTDKLQLLLNTNTSKDGSGEVGRPKVSDTQISESGQQSRDQ